MRRRNLLLTIAVSTAGVSGCTGGSPDPDVQIEYQVTIGKEPEQMPEDIRDIHRGAENPDGARREGHKWVVVEIDVLDGVLSMEDIWFRSRVETQDRFYDLDHASDQLSDGVQSRGEIKQDGSAIALYQISENSEFVSWNLDETQQDIERTER